jgi:hypothetical protein
VSVKQVDWVNSINWRVFSPRLHVNLIESRYKAPHGAFQKKSIINQGHILVLYSVSKLFSCFFYQILLVIVGSSVSGLVCPLFRYGFILGYTLVRFILIIICLGLDFAIVLFGVIILVRLYFCYLSCS